MTHTAIVYTGGAYGTYLEWVLTTLMSNCPIVPPFRPNGNSHDFSGIHAGNINHPRWKKFVADNSFPSLIRIHPKSPNRDTNLSDTLKALIESNYKIIHLYPDEKSILLNVNNVYKKVWGRDWWQERLKDPVFCDNLYSNWLIDQTTQIDDISVWIKREILSFNLMPSWFNEVEWESLGQQSHPRYKPVALLDLLYDFENIISDIQKFCDLQFVKKIQDMVPSHQLMLSLQQDLTQDQLCSKIVESTLSNLDFDWSNQTVPLPSEAWIQWELRNRGFEIRCNGLDIFPTNSLQLRELLYSV